MKIETRDMVPEIEPEPEQQRAVDPGIVGRAGIALVLACFLLVALQWAVNITNANARQVSTNLSSLQGGFEQPLAASAHSRRSDREKHRGASSSDGPVLEPVDLR